MFIDKIKPAVNIQHGIYDRIKASGKPVVIFGGGQMSIYLEDTLRKHGVSIYAYAVEPKYYRENKMRRGLPILNYEELMESDKQYTFLLGVSKDKERVVRFMNDHRGGNDRFAISTFMNLGFPPLTFDYIRENETKFEQTYNWLADNLSRESMIAFLNLKVSGDIRYLIPVVRPFSEQNFNELTLPKKSDATYVDCGAYNGDSVSMFIDFVGGRYGEIYAFEPDGKNFADLKSLIEDSELKNVTLINKGTWDKADILSFDMSEGMDSHLSESGTIKIPVDSIDNVLDGKRADLIKMDIEGAELKALQGAVRTIKKWQPILAVCVYHKREDLITLPQYIKSVVTCDYKFYLRKYDVTSEYDLILYAVPDAH